MSQISYYKVLSAPQSEGKGLSLKVSALGVPAQEGRFVLFPGGQSLRLKKARKMEDSGLFTLDVKGIARNAVRTGDILVSEADGVSQGNRALILWKKKIPVTTGLTLQLKDNPELKSADAVHCKEGDKAVMISSRVPFLQIPGQIYTLSQGRHRGECLLLMAEPWSGEEQSKMKSRLSKIKNFPGEKAVFSMNLRIRGSVALPPSLLDSDFDGSVRIGRWALMSRIYDRAVSTLEKRSRSEQGIEEASLAEVLGQPAPLCHDLAEKLIAEGRIMRSRGYLFNQCDDHRDFLSPMSRMWLQKLDEKAYQGFTMKETFSMGDRLQALERRGLIRIYDSFVVSEDEFQKTLKAFAEELPRDREFDLNDVKSLMGLSRTRVLILLDELEKLGRLSRDEEQNRRLLDPQDREE